jgi:hypothetical protein
VGVNGAERRKKERPNLSREDARFILKPAVGDANNSITGRRQSCVSPSVALEGSAVVVEFEAVELDDQTLRRPKGVDLAIEDADVEARIRKMLGATEASKALLERGASGERRLCGVEQWADQLQGASPVPSNADPLDLLQLQQPQAIRLLPRRVQNVPIDGFGEVEEGSSDRGHGHPPVHAAIGVLYAAFMDAYPRPASAPGRRHFDRAAIAGQSPAGGGAPMAEHGPISTGQDGRHPLRVRAQAPHPDCVDAAMHAAQTPFLDAPSDGPHTEAGREQLLPGEDPVLTARQLRERTLAHRAHTPAPLPTTCRLFGAHIGL